jgi:anthranilate phosphoribosyltransferase
MVGPNETVLEAQAMVCTGPHQTRPLGIKPSDPDPATVLGLILDSLRGRLPRDIAVSRTQMGAFFAAMTIRKGFPPKTNWSREEAIAFRSFESDFETDLPPELRFLMNPTTTFEPKNVAEREVAEALLQILAGDHLTYSQTVKLGKNVFRGDVRNALKGAALIGQRMNRETFDEARGYLDSAFDPNEILTISTHSLTHFGEPYDGSTRYFRPTVFIAAVRAGLGRPTLIHGVDQMPPKEGVTDEQILSALGANTQITPPQAAELVEDPTVGFAYLSQQSYSPEAYAAREIRRHIQKRPPWAATEKAQLLMQSTGANHMVIGYYHSGYEELFLKLIEERDLDSGLVTKGLEGCSSFSLRTSRTSEPDHKAVNSTIGTKKERGKFVRFSAHANPVDFGFNYEKHPRPESVSAEGFAATGLEALSGKRGETFDQLIFNVGIKDHLLGFCSDPAESVALAADVIESGQALSHLNAYLNRSNTSAGHPNQPAD